MKLDGSVIDGPFAEEATLREALEPQAKPEPGIVRLDTELLHQMRRYVPVLQANLEQGWVVDHEVPEYSHACLNEIRRRIVAGGKLVQGVSEQVEGPFAEPNDEALLRPENNVHGAGCRPGQIRDAADRQARHSMLRDDLFRRIEKRFTCFGTVFFRAPHVDTISERT